jgi:RNA polymerase sigma-70 factor (ECF subfamily)
MEHELVVRAQHGDADAFSALTAPRRGRLLAVARLILRDEDRAADAVQDALLQAWLDLRGLRDPERFDAWLNRLLVRSCHRAAGHLRVRTVAEIGIDGTAEPATRESQHDIVLRDQLERAFRRLSPEHRSILVLRHYLGLSQAETAAALGVPLGTVQSRLDRATRTMRASLEADDRLAPVPGAAAP